MAIPVRAIPSQGQGGGPGECVVTFGPAAPVTAIAFDPEGKTLAVGGYREVVIWDLVEARLSKRLGGGKLGGQVRGLAYASDGRLLAAAAGPPGGPATVELFDLQTGGPTATLEGPKDEVFSIAVSPDGKLLAAGGADATVRVWNLEDKKLVATLKESGEWVLSVAFSPDGKYLATAGADRIVRLWDTATWKSEIQYPQSEAVQGIAFNHDAGAMALALGGPNAESIRIRRKQPAVPAPQPKPKAKPAAPPPLPPKDYATQVAAIDTGAAVPQGIAWNRQDTRIYVPANDKTVKVVAPAANRIVASLAGHADWVYCVAASPDGGKLASGSADGTVKLWNAGGESLIATLVQLAAGTDQWLIVTAQGDFSGSATAGVRWWGGPGTPNVKQDTVVARPEAVKAAITAPTEPPSAVAATNASRKVPPSGKPRPKKPMPN
jgi:WD40 repeat protein